MRIINSSLTQHGLQHARTESVKPLSVELKNVAKVVNGETHIHATDLVLQDAEFNVLLGATLSGKTTLMRLMAGLEKPTSGEVWFAGQNVTDMPVQKRNIAMVYQEFINYPNFTVFENIASPLRVAGKKRTEIDHRVNEIAELLNLSELLDRDVANLSGGQQQRTALARALVKDASLILLDEPLANLDYKLREQLREELPGLFTKSGSTVVYATSEPEEALMLGGHVATLKEGRVVQYGKTIDIYRQPNNLDCARIFSYPPINIATVNKSASTISLPGIAKWQSPDVLDSCPDGDYILGVRPHHLSLPGTRPPEHCVEFQGTVQLSEISGSESLIHLQVLDNDWIVESSGVHSLSIGSQVEVQMKLNACLYFDKNGNSIH